MNDLNRLLGTKVLHELNFDGDILITDPCYFYDEQKGYLDYPTCAIENSTLYGDWSCHVWEKDNNENVLGQFCADSGMVIVADYDQVKRYNPDVEKFVNTHPWCATVIKGFKGRVQMIQFEYEYEHSTSCDPDKPWGWRKGDKFKDTSLELHGTGNINWIGAQTGF